MQAPLDKFVVPAEVKPSGDSVRPYLAIVCLFISFVIISLFWGFQLRSEALIEQQMLHNSRAFFKEIVITRYWLARHQGVYVPMQPGDEVNPYLKKSLA